MKLRFYFLFLFVFISFLSQAQKITGCIFDSDTKKPLVGANIQIKSNAKGSISDNNGKFEITGLKAGNYDLIFSFIGYSNISKTITLNTENIYLEISLSRQIFETNPVVITATRTIQNAENIPARIQSINKIQLAANPASDIDASLAYIPGVNVNRTLGIFANKSIVSMRGLSGKDQSRTLVMIDGIPINKTDGGSVNWNLFGKEYVEKIEVSKGPVSSLYGSNAMGGAINIISRKPEKKFEGNAELSYGTFNTKAANISLGGRQHTDAKGFYWMLSGFATKSDGYIAQTAANITPYTVKSYLTEVGSNFKVGYEINKNQQIESSFSFYNDERGGGETVYEEKGNYTQHQTFHSRTTYKYTASKTNITASLFYLRENYKAVNEYIKDATYTLYDVDSKRTDAGLIFNISHKVSDRNIITTGFDLKQGSVDAADVYYSSTDKINNKGKMNFLAVFVQDEHELLKDKLKIIAGLRMDYAKYADGAFTIDYPSEANNYLNIYQIQSIPDADFNALSPKISLLYKLNSNAKLYASYAIGFRPPTLDDMCRSGKIKGGFKVVNPYLKPEYLTNYEVGVTINYHKWQFTPSVFYSAGKDFMYYVNTGDSVNQGFKVSPVFQSRNISKVEIYGFETGINYIINDKISVFASYAYSHSQIKEYKILNPLKDVDLTDKYLTDVPEHSASLAVMWNSKLVNLAVFAKYVGKKWVNDGNIADDKYGLDAQYPDYILINLNLKRQILSFADARLSVENVFDKMIYDSKNLRATGRFITLGINFKF